MLDLIDHNVLHKHSEDMLLLNYSLFAKYSVMYMKAQE